jgi:hypothetical protein
MSLTCLLLTLAATPVDAGAVAALDASVPEAGASNLLRRATITRASGAPDAQRMADGTAPTDGDVWKSAHTAVLAAGGAVEWDLGVVRPVRAARLQADNNDTYLLSGSIDGVTWGPVWAARSVEIPGVQTRTSDPLDVQVRYLRLTAEGGDAMYSVGELEVFESVSDLVGAQLRRVPLPPPPTPVPPPPFDSGLLVVLAAAGLGAHLLRDARRRNLARKRTPPPEGA